MSIARDLKATADDPKTGMTLAELGAFVDQARHDGIPDATVLNARVNMRGGIKKLETKP